MQGVAKQPDLISSNNNKYLISHEDNQKMRSVAIKQAAANSGSLCANFIESPAYLVELSDGDKEVNDSMSQFYKENGIDPKDAATELVMEDVGEKWDKDSRSSWMEAMIGGMLNSFGSGHCVPFGQGCFKQYTHQLITSLNSYTEKYGDDKSVYEDVMKYLQEEDSEGKNPIVQYAKSLVEKAMRGETILEDDSQAAARDEAFNLGYKEKIDLYHQEEASRMEEAKSSERKQDDGSKFLQEKIKRLNKKIQELTHGKLLSEGVQTKIERLQDEITQLQDQLRVLRERD